MLWFPRVASLLAIILATTVAVLYFYHFVRPVESTVDEVFRDDENEQIERSIKVFRKAQSELDQGIVTRGAHAKSHACVKAYFTINDDLDTSLRHGVFSEPGRQYKSWVRFSNGASRAEGNDDFKKDARGMAIKILEPPKTELRPGDIGAPQPGFSNA